MNRWHQHEWVGNVFLHLVKCYLAFFIPFTRIMFSKHLEDRITLGSNLRDEPGYVIQPSHKASNFLLGSRRRKILYRPYLVRNNFNSSLMTTNPSNFSNVTLKVHFAGLSFSWNFLNRSNSFLKFTTCSSSP